MLGHLRPASTQFARRQGGQHRGIGQHRAGLVEGAQQVLALRGIDTGLATHRTIDLRQQRGRALHEGQAAQDGGGGEAGQITHHATAQRHHRHAAVRPRGQNGLHHPLILRHGFGTLAGRHQAFHGDAEARLGQPGAQGGQMQRRHRLIGDNGHALAGQGIGQMRTSAAEQPRPHQHIIAPSAQRHRQAGGGAMAQHRLFHPLRCGFRMFIHTFDHNISLGEYRMAALGQPFQHLGRVLVEK